MPDYKLIETQRLLLKPITINDANFIFKLMNTPKWIQFIGDRNVRSVKDAENYIIEKVFPQQKTYGYSNNIVSRKQDGLKLGTCGLYHREDMKGVDIGFAFLPEYHNKGYAFEAANKLMHSAKELFAIDALSGFTMKENLTSRKLLERLGFKLIGLAKLPNSTDNLLHYYRTLKI
ncbi:MAG: GNAT family N-acetyltransferase [Winogradskyella sp.]|uniref:GNAT family N-acetyltransferase n=1 Tax=Winogradskyella sp. TaxID=1883156 RepID=UPI00182981BD|nr:GNAT family N-acetyltransferase [Winogradskyella sp.]